MEQELDILIQYRDADIDKKLHLFLQFPDLRNAFQEIERKDLAFQRGFRSLLEEQKSAMIKLGDKTLIGAKNSQLEPNGLVTF